MRSPVSAALIVITYLAAVNVFLTPVQFRVWNYLNGIDVLVMLALVVPFIATRWVSSSNLRATRVAWYLAAVMALDIVFFAIMAFAPTGGHPSLESLVLLFTGLLKVLLVPAALVALGIAFTKGEKNLHYYSWSHLHGLRNRLRRPRPEPSVPMATASQLAQVGRLKIEWQLTNRNQLVVAPGRLTSG